MARAKNIPQVNGEVLPRPDEQPLFDTMAVPDLAAVEASLERSRLLLDYGIDAVAMALDASASIEAANSLEKMLAHQLAALHLTGMELLGRVEQSELTRLPPVEVVRMTNAGWPAASRWRGFCTTAWGATLDGRLKPFLEEHS